MSKTASILIRVSPEQKAIYDAKAIKHGFNLSQLTLAALDAYGEPVAKVISTPAEAKQIVQTLPKPEEKKRRPPTEEELGYAGLKANAVEGVDYIWRGNKCVMLGR